MTRHDTTRRMRGIVAASAAALLTTGLIAGSASADPDVTAEDVEAALHEVSAINEKVNGLELEIEDSEKAIDDLSQEIEKNEAAVAEHRDVLARFVVQQQMEAPLGNTVQLLGSENPEVLMEGLSAAQALGEQQLYTVQAFQKADSAQKNRRAALTAQKSDLTDRLSTLEQTQDEMQTRHDRVEQQLESLNAEQQEQATGADRVEELDETPDVALDSNASGRAADAIAFARAQLGDAYVYGGTGPDAWDCSGLTQGAWGAAGVSIPRVAGAQYSAGQDVPIGSVQPGDLVFYPDMSHTGIYIGNGQVIHAANPRRPAEVTSIGYGFTKAARVG